MNREQLEQIRRDATIWPQYDATRLVRRLCDVLLAEAGSGESSDGSHKGLRPDTPVPATVPPNTAETVYDKLRYCEGIHRVASVLNAGISDEQVPLPSTTVPFSDPKRIAYLFDPLNRNPNTETMLTITSERVFKLEIKLTEQEAVELATICAVCARSDVAYRLGEAFEQEGIEFDSSLLEKPDIEICFLPND